MVVIAMLVVACNSTPSGPGGDAALSPVSANTPVPDPRAAGVSAKDAVPCPLWPADNIWNRRVDALPTLALSGAYVATMGAGDPLHSGFGSRTWEGQSIGVPYMVVPTAQPEVPVGFTDYPDMSDAGPYPYPTNATVQGATYRTPVPSSGDRHVLVLRAGDCTLFETWHSTPNSDGRGLRRTELCSISIRICSGPPDGLPPMQVDLRYCRDY